MIKTENYMSIYGKFMSKRSMMVNLQLLNLDPVNQDQDNNNILATQRKLSNGVEAKTALVSDVH